MTTTDKSLLSRIKKLMNLTTDRGATPEEAATAAAKVQEILFEHNLTMSQVAAHTPESKEDITQTTVRFKASNKRSLRWRRRLHSNIATHYFCDTVYFSHDHGMLVFIGKPSNVEVCVYMAEMIGDQIHKMGLKEYNAQNALGYGNPTSTYTAYCTGAVMTVNERMAQQTRKQASTGNALMVVNKQDLEAAMKKFFPKLGKTRSSRITDAEAFRRGRRDGHSVSITTGIGQKASGTKGLR